MDTPHDPNDEADLEHRKLEYELANAQLVYYVAQAGEVGIDLTNRYYSVMAKLADAKARFLGAQLNLRDVMMIRIATRNYEEAKSQLIAELKAVTTALDDYFAPYKERVAVAERALMEHRAKYGPPMLIVFDFSRTGRVGVELI